MPQSNDDPEVDLTEEERKQREQARAEYLASLREQKPEEFDFTPKPNLTIKERVDMIMSQLNFKQNGGGNPTRAPIVRHSIPRPRKLVEPMEKRPRAKHTMLNVYGSSGKAAKTRRCGECEGCTRDDCGKCAACADKPKFGGRGSKKKACTARTCRMRGPPSQGQALAVSLKEGQTYQIVGYMNTKVSAELKTEESEKEEKCKVETTANPPSTTVNTK